MPSIVIDARMVNSSGIGVYIKQTIPYLLPLAKVIVLGRKEELQKFSWAPQVTIIPISAPIYSIKEQVELCWKIPTCDVFWSPHYTTPLLPIRAKRRLVTIHDTYHLAYRQNLTLKQKIYATLFLNAAVRVADQVVTVSNFSKKEITHYTHCAPEKVTVIHSGVDKSIFHEDFSATQIKELRSQLPALPKQDYLLYVGNVKPHKNLKTLLAAYALLPLALRQKFHLVIVGQKQGFLTPDQEVFKQLERQPELKNFVHFTGFVPDSLLPLLYKCASLSVFPSIYEGFGLPPLESMACGCPVVASTSASIPEVCGDAVLYFDALNVDQLRQQMERVLQDQPLQAELIQKGRERCLKFSWEASSLKHVQLFKKLLETV
ncbi:glycosyltransferase family 4 protein [Rufibacter quisquiliarum]|uniref:Glycosyltransferase involved in cell wall biosynthesis n=1 Tax=Rufibacter quisquiliarum TaxID=1549639 RepID=A0A839GSR5_9BACT|nr:glycosyltransferase family 1 protein [Rufibacter quisquiliarum]MBA9077846.1 glycosyltransferase involved in cell wall biosynthesis [Rufibacter quisquiliarum]